MTTHVEIGMNRTGIATSGDLSTEMIEGTREFLPSTPGDEREIMRVREEYAKRADAIGSVPPPARLKGVVKTAKQVLKGEHPTQFIDKLGERLAFERTGVRLYEALLSKHDAYGGFQGGPQRSDLEHILMEELEHFRMLNTALVQLGADPTVVTPSADLHATMGKGIIEALVRIRARNLMQGLEAVLLAELADNDSWHALVQLAEQAGEIELAKRFLEAELHEREHLVRVRTWLAAAQDRPQRGTAQSTLSGF